MVEYVTKEEVLTILMDEQQNAILSGKQEAADGFNSVSKRIKKLYSVRKGSPGNWKTLGINKEVIYCGVCGFKTKAYRNTPYCPMCGTKMVNGVAR